MPLPPPVISASFPLSILVTAKLWVAFFEKCSHAFVSVVRFEATQLSFGFVAQHLFEVRSFTHVDRVLRCGECDWRRRAQTLGELQRRTFQLFGRYDLIHDA